MCNVFGTWSDVFIIIGTCDGGLAVVVSGRASNIKIQDDAYNCSLSHNNSKSM